MAKATKRQKDDDEIRYFAVPCPRCGEDLSVYAKDLHNWQSETCRKCGEGVWRDGGKQKATCRRCRK